MLIVRKYGGTSVGSRARIEAVARQVVELHGAGHAVAVVVSAMGDTTDRLLDLARELDAEPDARELDALLATGEMVSAALLALALRRLGQAARSWNALQLPIETSGRPGRARIERIDVTGLREDLALGVVPVVAGFQGRAANGDLTTIGRGGSDTTAVALAAALGAGECQILTDVDGVYTTDPRMEPRARRLERISFEEMLELAGQGSRVLHLRSVECAARHGVRLRVLSSFAPGPGTLICAEEDTMEAPLVSGIAFNRDEAAITVADVPDRPGTAHALLAPLAAAGIELDMIVVNAPRGGRVDLTFTVHRDDYQAALGLARTAAAGCGPARVEGDAGVAKLAVVGSGMRSHAGVAATLFATLAAQGINIRLVSTSEIKISVLVGEADLERAVRALHAAFALGESAPA
ncbi:MAG: aspartate kinase [Gammaproteobacteria bacterium]|nr:aspartate kinase [Gammaproteobacteria bacterium]